MISLLMDLPITSERERELRRACRGALALGLVTIAYGLIRAPAGLDDWHLLPYMWPLGVAAALYAVLGWWLFRAHVEAWRMLEQEHFRKCPTCVLTMVRAASGGTCMECERHMGTDALRSAWLAVYRRHVRSMKPALLRMPAEFKKAKVA